MQWLLTENLLSAFFWLFLFFRKSYLLFPRKIPVLRSQQLKVLHQLNPS